MGGTGTIDLRTTGRRSGKYRWVETWYVRVEGRLILTGTPGPRDWLANLAADPRAVVRFRDPVREVEVSARVITDPAERRRLVPLIWAAQPWYAAQGEVDRGLDRRGPDGGVVRWLTRWPGSLRC